MSSENNAMAVVYVHHVVLSPHRWGRRKTTLFRVVGKAQRQPKTTSTTMQISSDELKDNMQDNGPHSRADKWILREELSGVDQDNPIPLVRWNWFSQPRVGTKGDRS
jgi:hypothetical protein